ncbi:MAG: tyrosine-type recombinase/integrase, partial [Deltaproteobacteria bacterium]|nr:tyrosine-type recombinase/integrase [Deltaproteobacteria bacterium]
MDLPGINEFISQYDSKETRRAYKRDIDQFFAFRKKEPKEVSKLDFIAYLNLLKEKQMSTVSISRIFSTLRNYMSFLVSIDEMPKNPVETIKLPKVHRRMKDEITDNELIKFLSKIGNSWMGLRDRAVVYLMLYNGLRRGEICKLQIKDVFKTQDGIVIEVLGKGNKPRTRPIHPECLKAIEKYLKSIGRAKSPMGEPIFVTRTGRPMKENDVYNIVKKYSLKAGLKGIHPHGFRAKFTSRALESGASLTSV